MAAPAQGSRAYIARFREFGLAHAAISALRSVARRMSQVLYGVVDALEAQLLRIEGEKGLLGPAHRAYAGHSSGENRAIWQTWDWSRRGEEWDDTEQPEEWRASLIEHVLLPELAAGGAVLEIGPGGGRWSETIVQRADRLVLVDVAERVLDLCRERFAAAANVEYVLTGGSSLQDVADDSIDLVWSFDAFVHIAPLDVASYLSEVSRVLKPGGRAVIHHAGRFRRGPGWRSPMTGALFGRLAQERGLRVVRQFDSWGDGRFGVRTNQDVITVLETAS